MHPFDQLISTFSASGKQFEVLCKWILETDPTYGNMLEKVWLWDDWPGNWGADLGIDLIAQDTDGKIWAIQAKNYNSDYYITKDDIDSFMSESDNAQIDCRMLIATTENIGPNAIKVIDRSTSVRPFFSLKLEALKNLPIQWPKSLDDLSSGGLIEKYKPKPYQQKAIKDVATGFEKHDRAQLIMACGTGKTFVGLWISEQLKANNTLVLFPSLLLLSKTLAEWNAHGNDVFKCLPVCSDGTVNKKADDSISFKTSELSLPSTTDEREIAEFLKKDGRKVIFSTYQSSPQIAAAYQSTDLPPLDLVIADEAHRCAGKAGADYTTVLDNEKIPATKRLFMTATPRIFQSFIKKRAEESGVEVNSMDDENLFGPVLHKLSFGKAIERDLLSDYQVAIVGVDDALYAEMISEREFVQTENEIETDAQSFASHIGLAKAIKEYDLRRVITFHSKVKSADDFQKDFSGVVDWMPEASRPNGEFVTNYVSGAMSTGQRNQNLRRLGELEDNERAILSNARCLSEGVDVPALDGVAFIDPRNSEIDIVQAVGRAIRLSSGKTVGTIIIPVFIKEHEDPDEVLKESAFKKVWAIVNALRSHDEELGIQLDNLRRGLGKRGSVGRPDKIIFDLPVKITVEFEKALSVKLIESTTASWEFYFGLLEKYIEEYGECLIPSNYETPERYKLGTWVGNIRNRRKTLSDSVIKQLDDVGFIWNVIDYKWEQGFAELEKYNRKYGNCSVKKGYEKNGFDLGAWIITLRGRRLKGTLSDIQIERLNSLGFKWDPRSELWEEQFEMLKRYKEEHGHANFPQGQRYQDYDLGSWVGWQRQYRSKGTLSQTRIDKLNSIGFLWNPNSDVWKLSLDALKQYKEKNGHVQIKKGELVEGLNLFSWSNKQRSQKEHLEDWQIEDLKALGFTFNPYKESWEKHFKALERYKRENGHCKVPGKTKHFGLSLGTWVSKVRSKKSELTESQKIRLDELGFSWDPHRESWEAGFEALKKFKEEHGHCKPKSGTIVNSIKMKSWIQIQRRNKESIGSTNIKRLNDLGFSWDPLEEDWEVGFEALKKFIADNGHCRLGEKVVDGIQLKNWAAVQRKNKKKMDPVNIKRLNDIGFSWDPKKENWDENLHFLKEYQREKGHLSPLQTETFRDYPIGTLVAALRGTRKKRINTKSSRRSK